MENSIFIYSKDTLGTNFSLSSLCFYVVGVCFDDIKTKEITQKKLKCNIYL